MGTTTTRVTAVTNLNILQEIKNRNTNKNAVAQQAGIPKTTFNRKVDGKADFTLAELGDIAEALGITLGDILPVDLITAKVAA